LKICRFDVHSLGLVDGALIRDVTSALDCLPRDAYPRSPGDAFIENLDAVKAQIGRIAPTAPTRPIADVRLASPVANPGKIIGAPVNYRKHLDEAREQVQIHHNQPVAEIERIGLFLKATSSLVGPSEGIQLQHLSRRNDHEVELVAVIGRGGRNIKVGQALDHVAGYCIGLDMTVRGTEDRSMRKSIDSYSVLGPWLVTADEIANPRGLDLRLSVNGQLRQCANTNDLILNVAQLIEFASSFYTLHPGDLLYTGTPEGVGPVQPGDAIYAEISGIGSMSLAVRAASGAC
jgi:2-keto-4-pentenoate hydratase/2-oxohepta-3-ene-1,7-dioic acid hydratase in catechol pathway